MDIKLNLKKDENDTRDFRLSVSPSKRYLTENNIVKIIDHSQQMSSVKNQGGLGSCVAFAISALKEWQEKKEFVFEKYVLGKEKQRKDEEEYNFSEQWIYYNAKKLDPWPNEEGTSIRYGMKVLHKVGVPVEDGWQYNDIDRGHPEKWSHLVARWNRIDSYYRVQDLAELKDALLDSPVVIGIAVFIEFLNNPLNGVIQLPSNPDECYGGHAICIVGFDDIKKLVKFKNSWGEDWGDNGYGYLPYEYIENYMWDAWACKDLQVTKSMLKGKQEEMFLY
jgi:C1A family cysteine protease